MPLATVASKIYRLYIFDATVAFGNRRVEDIQPVFVQINANVGPRLIGIGELQLVSCHEVDVMEGVKCHFHAGFLAVLRGGVLDGSENVDLPVHWSSKV